MLIPRIILIGSWTLFLLIWTVMAARTKKTIHVQSQTDKWAYMAPLLLGILLMSGLPRSLGPLAILARPVMIRTPALAWIGAIAAALGLVIAVWARVTLGRNWSGEITLKEDHELVTRGPYAAIRHPIYTALILLFLGLAVPIASPGGYLGLLLVVWSCWVKLKQEEALMLRQFPDAYPAYMARTKRLLPVLI